MEVPSQWEVDELTERVKVLEDVVDILVRKGLIRLQYVVKGFNIKETFNTKKEACKRVVDLQNQTNRNYKIETIYSG